MKLIIWALYAVAPVALVLGNNGKSNVYKILSVPSSVIDGVTSESIKTINRIACASEAMRRPLGHLFCFKKETGACSLYDIRLPANYEAVVDDNPNISCYTNETEGCRDGNQYLLEGESQIENNYEVTCINKILIKRCIDGDQTILEGETQLETNYEVSCLNKTLTKRCVDGNLTVLEGDSVIVDTLEATCSNKILTKRCVHGGSFYNEGTARADTCFTLTCTQGVWAYPDFIPVTGTGNIWIEVNVYKVFSGAKQCCEDFGARLVIPDDYEGLKQYMVNNYDASNYYYWVGIQNQIWMDGQSVVANAWYTSEPDSGEDCAVMRPYYQGLLIGYTCSTTSTNRFICQKV